MSIWNAIILGLVQGIAEFLPISSSGHLSILQNLFHMSTTENGHLFFDVLLHLGTLISICIVYWRDIVAMVREVFAFFRNTRLPAEQRQQQLQAAADVPDLRQPQQVGQGHRLYPLAARHRCFRCGAQGSVRLYRKR